MMGCLVGVVALVGAGASLVLLAWAFVEAPLTTAVTVTIGLVLVGGLLRRSWRWLTGGTRHSP